MEQRLRLVKFEENKAGSCVSSSTWTSLKRGQIPSKTGKGKAKGQGQAQERTRSARPIERRILRGAAKRAESFLNTTEEQASGSTNRPDHNQLDYVEGLRLQAVPEQEVPEFLDVHRTVVGGLPTNNRAGGAAKRVWGKFEKDYPSLAKVVQSTPGVRQESPSPKRKEADEWHKDSLEQGHTRANHTATA